MFHHSAQKPLHAKNPHLMIFMITMLMALAAGGATVWKFNQATPVKAQGSLASSINSISRIFVVNVPALFRELVTMAALEVEGESIFGGEVTFDNDVVFDGQLTLNGDAFGQGVSIDLGDGEITASNVIYSLEAGSGISISEGQNPTISATDLGSSQNIFKKVKIGSDTLESDQNSDTLEFAAGSGISLSTDTGSDKITITNSSLPGFVKSGTYAVLESGITRVGIGTSTPSTTLEIVSEAANTSGVKFTNLTSASPVGLGGGKVLSVDSGGNLILVTDESGGVSEGDLDSALPGGSLGSTIYHDGSTWAHSTNLYHNGGQIGVSTVPTTNVRFDIKTNATDTVGLVVRRVSSQTADLMQFRNESDTVLSYFDADGVFHGQTAGGLNPGLTNGSVLFQGASGITQDNSNFYWDDTNNRLGIGSGSSVPEPLSVFSTNQVLSSGRGQIGAYSTDAQGTDLGGQIVLGGQDGNGRRSFAAVAGRKENATSGDRSGYLQFSTRATGPGTTDLTERMRITSGGLVGIGTSSPLAKLHVAGTADDQQLIVQANSTQTLNLQEWQNSAGGALAYMTPAGDLSVQRLITNTVGDAVDNNSWLVFTRLNASNNDITIGNSGTNTLTATLKDNGRFGIGTSSLTPVHKLHVSGNYGGNALVAFNETGGQNILTASASGTTRLLLSNTGQLGINSSSFINANNLLRINGSAAVTNPTVYIDGDLTANDSDPQIFLRGRYIGVSTQLHIKSGGSNPSIVASGGSNDLILQHSGNNGKGVLFYDEASNPIMHLHNNGTGRVGIGLVQSVHKLHVQDAVTGKALVALNETGNQDILVASASGTTRMVLTNSGYLGLGTTTPRSPLDVIGNQSITGNIIFDNTYGAIFKNTTGGQTARVIVDNGNNFGVNHNHATGSMYVGLNQIGQTGDLYLQTAGTQQLTILDTGNVGIGTTSPGDKLTIFNGDFRVQRDDTTSGEMSFYWGGNTAYGGKVLSNLSSTTSYPNGYGLVLGTVFSSSPSSSYDQVRVLDNFNPTSGSAISNALSVIPTINQTGGANGITRGLYINPTLTAAANWRGIEIANNSGYGIYQSGASASNYFAGGVGIGSTTVPAGSNLYVVGSGQSAIRIDSTAESGIRLVSDTAGTSDSWHMLGSTSGTFVLQSDGTTNPFQIEKGTPTNTLYLDSTSTGRVGIGNTTPQYSLDVTGSIRSSTTLFVTSGIIRGGPMLGLLVLSGSNTSVLDVISESSAQVGLRVLGSASQTADLIRVFSDLGTTRVMTLSAAGNLGLGTSTFGTNAAKVFAIAGSTAPTTSITDGIQLFAVDVAGSHELQVQDEAGNTTTLSPHNFSVIGDKSEELAWSFYSERNSLAINADMTKALRIVEKLSGEKLIYLKDLASGQLLEEESDATRLTELADNGSIGEIAKWNYQLWTFVGEVIFEKPVQFLADVTLKGRIFFSPDQVGVASIPAGATAVKVSFTQTLPVIPIIQLTPQQSIPAGIALKEVTTSYFVIELPQALDKEVEVNWFAALRNTDNLQQPKIEVITPAGSPAATPSPTVVPATPTPTQIPAATPEVSSSPSPTASPSSNISTEPSPSPTPVITPEPVATDSAVTP